MDYVIAGNGVAGVAAAQGIRKIDPGGGITIISDEAHPFYSRIRLMECLSGETDEKGLVIHDAPWYEESRIRLFSGVRILSIDVAARTLALDSRGSLNFGKLLLATGAVPIVPPFEGAGKAGLFTLRTLDDAKKIVSYSLGRKSILLIGGGALGLEAGYALRKRGLGVKVVEFFDRLLPRQLDPECASMLRRCLEGLGFEFCLGAEVKSISGEKAMDGVYLEDGRFLQADMALVSAGVRPEISLAANAGIRTAKGIMVDDHLRTSAAYVYAAGDCAEHRGVVYGIWPAAQAQGRIAGVNMAGKEELYEGTVPSNTVRVAGKEVFAAGNIDAEGRCECVRLKDEEKNVYRKLVLEDNRITGCILFGDTSHGSKILNAIEEKKDIRALRESIGRWSLEDL
jgi:nitrite reductase (NADH) large subunit